MALQLSSKALLRKFLSFVRIDSPSLNERAFAAVLKKELKKLGARVFEDRAGSSVKGNSGNILGIIKATAPKHPTVMLSAHMDTVAIGVNVKPRVVGGRVFTDGTSALGADDKSGVLVILETIRQLKLNRLPHGEIIIAFTVGEEIGLRGAHFISKIVCKADFGYALDGGAPERIHVKAPSQMMIRASIVGKAAHAGVHPEDGINAIQIAGRALAGMRLGRIDPVTTANIGVIHGGVAGNIVPELVELVGEARSHKESKLRAQVSHMQQQLARTSGRYKARLKCSVQRAFRFFDIPESEPVRQWAARAARRLKLKVVFDTTGGGSDANVFNVMGIPTIIMGTGMTGIHTPKENIAIKDIVTSIKLLFGVFQEITHAASPRKTN